MQSSNIYFKFYRACYYRAMENFLPDYAGFFWCTITLLLYSAGGKICACGGGGRNPETEINDPVIGSIKKCQESSCNVSIRKAHVTAFKHLLVNTKHHIGSILPSQSLHIWCRRRRDGWMRKWNEHPVSMLLVSRVKHGTHAPPTYKGACTFHHKRGYMKFLLSVESLEIWKRIEDSHMHHILPLKATIERLKKVAINQQIALHSHLDYTRH